jgi:putative nucleotidyltransferase with HDIG domain
MLRRYRQKDFSHPLLIWLVILFWYVIVANRLLLSPQAQFNDLITAQSFWLFNNPPPQTRDVTIVAIDQASRRRLGLKWPWKRSVTAQLIRNIASLSPRVIGLDIMFAGDSENEEDAALASALKAHPRVVLGYLLDGTGKEGPKRTFSEAASSIGFVNKPIDHGMVRAVRPYQRGSDSKVEPSIETAILLEYLGIGKEDMALDDRGISLKGGMHIPVTNGKTPLNYLVYHSNFTTIPASMVLGKKVDPADFKDKIVLVGSTDPIIHDELPTPLDNFPGVTILANSLVMFLSQRFVRHVSELHSILFALLLGCLVILINKELRFLKATLCSILILGLTYFGFVYFRSMDLVFPYFMILFSGTTAYVAFSLYKYTSLLYISNRLKNQAVVDPLTGLSTPRFFLLQLQERAKSKRSLAFIGIRLWNHQKLTMELSFEQIKMLIKKLSDYVVSEVKGYFKNSSIACLSTDTLGICLEGENDERIREFLKHFLGKSKELAWDLESKTIDNQLQACLILKSKDDTVEKPNVISQMDRLFRRGTKHRIVVEGLKDTPEETTGLARVDHLDTLDFLTFDWEEKNKDLEKNLKQLLETNRRLERLNLGTLTALARAIDAKSHWTAGHSERVTRLALQIARALGLTQEEQDDLHRAGLLHDIGKIATPPEILDKPTQLTEEERKIICGHPAEGARILEPIDDFASAIPIVFHHHERFDGSGYPAGLAGEAISLGARILAVADVFDAVTSNRPYREGMPVDRAVTIIKEGSGTQFDPKVVDAFVKVITQKARSNKHLLHEKPTPKTPHYLHTPPESVNNPTPTSSKSL